MDRICVNCAYFQPEVKCSENTVGYSGYGTCLNSRNSGRTAVSVCGTDLACRSGVMVDKTVRRPSKDELEKALNYPVKIDVSEPKKAYIIVSGEYSDFGINAVFLNKAEAERAVEIANRRDPHQGYSIQEWPIGLSFNPETDSLYFVSFYKGAVNEVKQCTLPYLTTMATNVVQPWNVYKYRDGKYYEHRMYIYARDEEHAKKKAADIFAKWKAEQEGIT